MPGGDHDVSLMYNLIHMYQFMRGSLRYAAIRKPYADANGPLYNGFFYATLRELTDIATDASGTPSYPGSALLGSSGLMITQCLERKVFEFEVPYDATVPFIPTTKNMWTDDWAWAVPMISIELAQNTATDTRLCKIYAAAGDDFDLSWLKNPLHYQVDIPAASPTDRDNNNNNNNNLPTNPK
jgi:hypothetical protein